MDCDRRIHFVDGPDETDRLRRIAELEQSVRTGIPPATRAGEFVTTWAMPEQCDAKKVLRALEKLGEATEPIPATDSALLSLTQFERGYVLGVLAEHRRWRAEQGR